MSGWTLQCKKFSTNKTSAVCTLGKYFHNVKKGLSIIMSKSSSKNLSNENKQ